MSINNYPRESGWLAGWLVGWLVAVASGHGAMDAGSV